MVESNSNQHYYNTVTNTLSSQRSANLVTASMSGNLLLLINNQFYFTLVGYIIRYRSVIAWLFINLINKDNTIM